MPTVAVLYIKLPSFAQVAHAWMLFFDSQQDPSTTHPSCNHLFFPIVTEDQATCRLHSGQSNISRTKNEVVKSHLFAWRHDVKWKKSYTDSF